MSASQKQQTNADYGNLGGYTADKYKASRELSDDSEAFSAVLKLNGKIVGDVSNRGHGGSHEYNFGSREERNAFDECAKTFYGGYEPEDAFVEELLARLEMRGFRRKKDAKNLPFLVLLRDGAQHIGKDCVFFNREQQFAFKTLELAQAKIKSRRPDEYVIYDSLADSFSARRYVPSRETIEQIERQEQEAANENERRLNSWTEPQPVENCERFLFSQNEANSVRISDTETKREAEIDAYSFRNGRKLLIALFGAAK